MSYNIVTYVYIYIHVATHDEGDHLICSYITEIKIHQQVAVYACLKPYAAHACLYTHRPTNIIAGLGLYIFFLPILDL